MFGMPRHRQVVIDDDATGAIALGAQPFGGRRRLDARRPHDGPRLDPLVAERDAAAVALGDGRAKTDFDAQLLERAPRRLRQRGIERRQQPRPGLDQNDAGRARIDRAEIHRQRTLGEFGDGAGHLDAGRPAADDDEIQQPAALVGIGFGFGALERQQNAAAQIGGVVDGLQARRIGCPVVAEIGVLGAGGDHQIVERESGGLRR